MSSSKTVKEYLPHIQKELQLKVSKFFNFNFFTGFSNGGTQAGNLLPVVWKAKQMKHYNISISGRVQRVGFRFSAMQAAYRHGVSGFVRNMKDDSVYIEAEGEEDAINLFLQWCRKGPPGARVDTAKISEGEMKNFKKFDILY